MARGRLVAGASLRATPRRRAGGGCGAGSLTAPLWRRPAHRAEARGGSMWRDLDAGPSCARCASAAPGPPPRLSLVCCAALLLAASAVLGLRTRRVAREVTLARRRGALASRALGRARCDAPPGRAASGFLVMFLRRARAAQAEPLGTDVAASGASQDVSLADAWRAAARDRAPRAPRAPRSRALAAAPRRTQREIGEILGISQSNVATKLSRLRAHLRGELAEEA